MKKEQGIHKAFCTYLKLQYPQVYFDSDPSGLRVSVGIRNILKATRSNHAHLDITILEPRKGYHGMIVELKSVTPFKKDGTLKKDDHLKDQAKTIANLTTRGYYVVQAWELDEAKRLVDEYLK